MPPTAEEMIDQAWEDVLAEFVGCLGEVPDEETVDELRKLFDKTIVKGINTAGAIWDEPARSFVLRYVCMTAKAVRHKSPMASSVQTTGDSMIAKARRTCDRVEQGGGELAQPIGILCPR